MKEQSREEQSHEEQSHEEQSGLSAEKTNPGWADGGELGLLLTLAAPEEAGLIKKIGSLTTELDGCMSQLIEKTESAGCELTDRIPGFNGIIEKVVAGAVREILTENMKSEETAEKSNPDAAS